MKKTITKMFAVASMVAGTVLSANAQIASGSLMFGGGLGANITTESTTKTTATGLTIPDQKTPGFTDWNFTPTVGYFISDGLAVGLALNISSTNVGSATTTDGKTTENIASSGLGVALFARKYMEVSDNVYFHTQAGLSYSSGSFTNRVPDGADKLKDGTKTSFSNIGLNITPGLTYFVSPKWGIDLSLNNILGYNMTTTKTESPAAGLIPATTTETSGGGFSIGAGLTPTLGLFYYMGK
jgi:hypothetical protein